MADTPKEPTKEKTKKKKSEGKKSEQARKASVNENATEAAETESRKPSATPEADTTEKPPSRKPSAIPDPEATEKTPSRKPSETPDIQTPEKTPSRKESATPDIQTPEKPASRKPSATPDTLAPPEKAPSRRQSTAEEKPPGTYRAPPAATKKDVELLDDLDEDKLMELKEAFQLFDLNQDGIIDASDLTNTYVTLGKKREEVDEKEIRHMLSEAINPLDFDAFVVLLGYKTIELDPEEVLREALSKWDYESNGLISEERIKNDLMTWGDKFTQEEVEMALEDAPIFAGNKEVMIDYVKFCKILCGLRKKTKEPAPEDFMKH